EYHAGRSFPEINAILARRGLSPELIRQVIDALAKDRAFILYSAGKSEAEIRDMLVERRMNRQDPESIAQTLEKSRNRAFASMGLGKWQTRSLAAGGMLLTVGVIVLGLERFAMVDLPGELITGLLGSGVLLAALGGVFIFFHAE